MKRKPEIWSSLLLKDSLRMGVGSIQKTMRVTTTHSHIHTHAELELWDSTRLSKSGIYTIVYIPISKLKLNRRIDWEREKEMRLSWTFWSIRKRTNGGNWHTWNFIWNRIFIKQKLKTKFEFRINLNEMIVHGKVCASAYVCGLE